MRQVIGFECWYFPVAKGGRISKLFSYACLFVKSLNALRCKQPGIVWVQLPQIPALWAALAYRALTTGDVKIIADCHNAQLRKPWCAFPLALWSLKRSDAILVHNEAMHAKAVELGWPMHKVLVLEDVPAIGKAQAPAGLAAAHIKAPKPWVLFPGSFAPDEPIHEVFEAARLAPELTFIITGRPERARQHGHDIDTRPSNVILPGFLSIELFDDLLREADIVMGLTREEGIQLSVCNEALGFGKPLITSDTRILRKLFGKAAVLVRTDDSVSIATGCKDALKNINELSVRSAFLARERVASWELMQLKQVSHLLSTVSRAI